MKTTRTIFLIAILCVTALVGTCANAAVSVGANVDHTNSCPEMVFPDENPDHSYPNDSINGYDARIGDDYYVHIDDALAAASGKTCVIYVLRSCEILNTFVLTDYTNLSISIGSNTVSSERTMFRTNGDNISLTLITYKGSFNGPTIVDNPYVPGHEGYSFELVVSGYLHSTDVMFRLCNASNVCIGGGRCSSEKSVIECSGIGIKDLLMTAVGCDSEGYDNCPTLSLIIRGTATINWTEITNNRSAAVCLMAGDLTLTSSTLIAGCFAAEKCGDDYTFMSNALVISNYAGDCVGKAAMNIYLDCNTYRYVDSVCFMPISVFVEENRVSEININAHSLQASQVCVLPPWFSDMKIMLNGVSIVPCSKSLCDLGTSIDELADVAVLRSMFWSESQVAVSG